MCGFVQYGLVEDPTMDYKDLKPLHGNPIENCVVLFHGYGADAENLMGLGLAWQRVLPRTYFYSCPAPLPFEDGPLGRQWFSLEDMSPQALNQGVLSTRSYIQKVLETLKTTHGLSDSHIALVGFSQGAMVALDFALHCSPALSAVISYSGLYASLSPRTPGPHPHILMIHGSDDQILPLDGYKVSKKSLEQQGVYVQGIVCQGLGHAIDEEGLRLGGDFLKTALYASAQKKISAAPL